MDEFVSKKERSVEAERDLELELEREFAVDPMWAEFGGILSAAHSIVYAGSESAKPGISASVAESVGPTYVHESLKCRPNDRRLRGRGGMAVSLAALVFAVVLAGVWWEMGKKTGPGTLSMQEMISHWEDEEISECDPEDEFFETADDFDWNAGEGELDDFGRLVQQVEHGEAPLDWEIAMLGDSLRELTEETEDEDWF